MLASNLENIQSALFYISSDCDRDTWIKIGMAVKSKLGDSGFDIFDAWSQQADSYKATHTRDAWKSIKSGGGVGIGTLFHIAKEQGWDPKKSSAPPSKDELKRGQSERTKRQEKDARTQLKKENKQKEVKTAAHRVWNSSGEADNQHPYLKRKQIESQGLKAVGEALVVPMREPDSGELWALQYIYPDKRSIRGSKELRDKDFLPGGRKQGLCHCMGNPENDKPIVIAEGYATAATIYEATGYAAYMAFDSGNIKHVAKSVRVLYPTAHIIVAADNDRWTKNNPGVKAACQAAKSIDGVAAIPEFPESEVTNIPDGKKGPSDFNDLLLLTGKEEVLRQIKLSLSKLTLNLPTGFHLNRKGVFFDDQNKNGSEWVCSPLKVSAVTRSDGNKDWGRLLEFSDMDGHIHQWAMPMQMLAGDGNEYRRILLDAGVLIHPSTRAKNLLTQYIQTCSPLERARCVTKTGWYDGLYVLPDEVVGKEGPERVLLQTVSGHSSGFGTRGDLITWQNEIASYCVGNSRLTLAVSTAFAPILQGLINMESGGVHFRGNSSIGKSTMLYVAASVWGGPERVRRWRTTDNGLESLAQAHNDSLLCLDELKELDPRDAGKVVYMLANGQGKQRAGRNGEHREPATWRLLYISTGEVSMADHIRDGGGRVHAGQEVRMIDIPAAPDNGSGVFEELHDMPSGVHFSQHLMKATRHHYGVPCREFIKRVANDLDAIPIQVQELRQRFSNEFVPAGADGQVHRVADRFSIIASAGELATDWGITGWAPGEALTAAKKCFDAWLNSRGGSGKKEVKDVIRQVRKFLQEHGDARFVPLKTEFESKFRTINRAGYRLINNNETIFYIITEVFRSEICKGFDHSFVVRVLNDHGYIYKTEGKRFDTKLPSKSPDDNVRHRVYAINGEILEAA